MNYVLGFKTEPSPCGSFCLCNAEDDADASDEDRREIELDSQFVDTADAATWHEGDA